MKNGTQGFTLIELLIVIAIIGILAAVLIPNLMGAQKKAFNAGAQSCGKSLQTALASYYIDKQTYVGADVSKTNADAAAGCNNSNITITAGTLTQDSYSFTVTDSRGNKTYTVTPTNMVASS